MVIMVNYVPRFFLFFFLGGGCNVFKDFWGQKKQQQQQQQQQQKNERKKEKNKQKAEQNKKKPTKSFGIKFGWKFPKISFFSLKLEFEVNV